MSFYITQRRWREKKWSRPCNSSNIRLLFVVEFPVFGDVKDKLS
jgi:hypothetical protein